MSHTPGPWEIEQCSKHEHYNYHIRTDDRGGFALVDDWDDANLIAAAPEMDGALDKLIFELDSITWDSQGPPSTLIDALEDARAVRDKARGES